MRYGPVAGAIAVCFTCASASETEYQISPRDFGGSKVLFTTPKGWQEGGIDREGVAFDLMGVNRSPDSPLLDIEARKYDFWISMDSAKAVSGFVHAIQHNHQNARDPQPTLQRIESFNAGKNGELSIWQIRSTSYYDFLLCVIIQDHVVVEIYLRAPDSKDLVSKIPTLKELARSVRIVNP